MKYAPVFPDRFGSLADARAFCEAFFAYYNHDHRHSGIGLHTPASIRHGIVDQIQARRATTLDAAYMASPDRFTRDPEPPKLPTAAWINQPQQGGIHAERLTTNCLKPLDTFRSATHGRYV